MIKIIEQIIIKSIKIIKGFIKMDFLCFNFLILIKVHLTLKFNNKLTVKRAANITILKDNKKYFW